MLFFFLFNQGNLYIIYFVSNSFTTFTIQWMNTIKGKTYDCFFHPVWYLKKNYWKRSSITSSVSSLTMIFMLSFFECILCSSSLYLKEIKLITIVNWIFHVSDFLRRFIFVVSRFYFFSLKGFLTSLIMLSFIFCLFEALKFSSQYVKKKICLEKIKSFILLEKVLIYF